MRRCTCWLCSICSCRIVSAALGPLCIPYVGPLCIPYVGTCCSVHQAGTRRLAAGAQARVRECPGSPTCGYAESCLWAGWSPSKRLAIPRTCTSRSRVSCCAGQRGAEGSRAAAGACARSRLCVLTSSRPDLGRRGLLPLRRVRQRRVAAPAIAEAPVQRRRQRNTAHRHVARRRPHASPPGSK